MVNLDGILRLYMRKGMHLQMVGSLMLCIALFLPRSNRHLGPITECVLSLPPHHIPTVSAHILEF